MLRSLVAQALSYRLLVIALSIVVAGLGAWAFVTLPVDAYPNIAQTQVKLILKAPGMTPEEVESRVIAPIEMEMLGIPKQAILRWHRHLLGTPASVGATDRRFGRYASIG